jgi:hypothetical protein
MKIIMIFLGCILTMLSCSLMKEGNVDVEKETQIETVDSINQSNKSLNDIRFAGWTEKEWLDNEYIRALRRHIDDFLNGEKSDQSLEQYKEDIKGKFVIANIEPYLLGGAFIQFCFIEQPDKVFSIWVYSEVNVKKGTVSNYECRGLILEEFESGFTKEEILKISAEHLDLKLW